MPLPRYPIPVQYTVGIASLKFSCPVDPKIYFYFKKIKLSRIPHTHTGTVYAVQYASSLVQPDLRVPLGSSVVSILVSGRVTLILNQNEFTRMVLDMAINLEIAVIAGVA